MAQKSAKEAPNMNLLKTKDRAVLPKPKLIVSIFNIQVLISSFNFKFQFQVLILIFNFKFQLLVSISSFNSKFQFQVSISCFNFKF